MLPFGGVIYGRLKVFVVEDFFITAYEQPSDYEDSYVISDKYTWRVFGHSIFRRIFRTCLRHCVDV